MAKCQDCGQEMLEGHSCTFTHIKVGDKVYERSTEHFNEDGGTCHDCGTKHGGYHHYGCDVERCPVCGGQLIGCDCFPDGKVELLKLEVKKSK